MPEIALPIGMKVMFMIACSAAAGYARFLYGIATYINVAKPWRDLALSGRESPHREVDGGPWLAPPPRAPHALYRDSAPRGLRASG